MSAKNRFRVTRTCTVLPQGDADGTNPQDTREHEPTPLAEFRSEPAYVLLGDPGMGKTTAFEMECGELGEEAAYVSARDFVTFDVDNHPEWQGKTLFIDGLDEVRAGVADARHPLDVIRRRLDKLERPRWRISCRAADWLGTNDLKHLAAVHPDRQNVSDHQYPTVKMLQLDPLTEHNRKQLLDAHPHVQDSEEFIGKADRLGIGGLLNNPQTLEMLAIAVMNEGTWPESRRETFEMACRKMADEPNDEHAYGKRLCLSTADQILEAAGYLSTVLLISGTAGYWLNPVERDREWIRLDVCDYQPRGDLRKALTTKLFRQAESQSEPRFEPVHRHIAEYLGARYVAKCIGEYLPIARILSLITGEDGNVVTPLRGLSAWLAAHSEPSRSILIERDALGVGLYGDIQGFSIKNKKRLLESLSRVTEHAEYANYQDNISALAPLASSEMEPTIREMLRDPCRDATHQIMIRSILQIICHGQALSNLSELLMDITCDDSWWPSVNDCALRAFVAVSPSNSETAEQLEKVLQELREGKVSDPDRNLAGTLLSNLYPRTINYSRVFNFLTEEGSRSYLGSYLMFWKYHLIRDASEDDLAALLDEFHKRAKGLRNAIEFHSLRELPTKLLARGLKAHGDGCDAARLYNWLRVGALIDWRQRSNDYVPEVQAWLEQRPDTLKAVILEGLNRCKDDYEYGQFQGELQLYLYQSSLPPDLGSWMLDKAVELVESNLPTARYLLIWAFRSNENNKSSHKLSKEMMRERINGIAPLEQELLEILDEEAKPITGESGQTIEDLEKDSERRHKKIQEAKRQDQEDWINYLQSNIEAWRDNRASPCHLSHLAFAYYGFRHRRRYKSPRRRLKAMLGNDDDLTNVVLAAFQGTVQRDDVPSSTEIIQLHLNSKMLYLAYPFLAGMDELEQCNPDHLRDLTNSQKRKAVALYYCYPTTRERHSEWYLRFVRSSPDLVSEVLEYYARRKIRSGKETPQCLYDFACRKDHAGIARRISVSLLRTFPARANSKQIESLDDLLWAALQLADGLIVRELVEEKLTLKSIDIAQRVRWTAAGSVIRPSVYSSQLDGLVRARDVRIRHLAEFFHNRPGVKFFPHGSRIELLSGECDVVFLETIVSLLGSLVGPFVPEEGNEASIVTLGMNVSEYVKVLLKALGSIPDLEVSKALDRLAADEPLRKWRRHIEQVQERRKVWLRDFFYRHPSIHEVNETLKNGTPSNPSDLAALVLDRLGEIARQIRGGNANAWRSYWNEDRYGRGDNPKNENSCRDVLLSDLRHVLPPDVEAQPEGQYANNNRADIRVSFAGFNVPVEIKKNSHRNLWSSIRNQLIAKYTTDPETRSYGIYLVLWFGDSADIQQTPPRNGPRPTTPEELKDQLERTLTEEESRKISICVMDVTPPDTRVMEQL